MKQIRVLVIIILILVVILGIKISGIKIFEKKGELTLEQVKEIVAKSENITNYYCEKEGEENGFFKSIKRKDNIKVEEPEETRSNYIIYRWINDEKNKVVCVSNSYHKDYPNKKVAVVQYTDLYKGNYYQQSLFDSILNQMEEYEYKGEEIYNKYDCIVVNFKMNDKSNVELWIDKESGFIMKEIIEEDGKTTYEVKLNYKFNCVTDDDVKEPDLSNYEVEEMK